MTRRRAGRGLRSPQRVQRLRCGSDSRSTSAGRLDEVATRARARGQERERLEWLRIVGAQRRVEMVAGTPRKVGMKVGRDVDMGGMRRRAEAERARQRRVVQALSRAELGVRFRSMSYVDRKEALRAPERWRDPVTRDERIHW